MNERWIATTLTLALLGAAPAAADDDIGSRQDPIVGGVEAVPGEFPAMVRLSGSPLGRTLCGGTLVAPRWVLTAAHCVERRAATGYYASVGMTRLRESSVYVQHIRGQAKVIHEAWGTRGPIRGDVALLFLERPVQFNDRVQLVAFGDDRNAGLPGHRLAVVGWGTIAFPDGDPSDTLLKAGIYRINDRECRDSYPNVAEDQFCGGLPEGGRDACKGDSGGPLFDIVRSANKYQIGLVNSGRGCAGPRDYTLYASIAYHRDWIERIMGPSGPIFCDDYARQAVAAAGEARRKGCAVDNNHDYWSEDYAVHRNWCASLSTAEPADRGTRERNNAARVCPGVGFCQAYAQDAAKDLAIARSRGCALANLPKEMRWSPDQNEHFKWCLSQGDSTGAQKLREIRRAAALACR